MLCPDAGGWLSISAKALVNPREATKSEAGGRYEQGTAMKTVRVWYTDFWPDFKPEDLFLLEGRSGDVEVVLDPKSPDVLFYSCFDTVHRTYDCVRVFYTGENVRPDFNVCDYGIGFDHMSFGDRYLRHPFYLEDLALAEQVRDRAPVDARLVEGRGFCTFIYSNGRADPVRDGFFHHLSRHRPVNSMGRHLRNDDSFARMTGLKPVPAKLKVMGDFNFAIAFENSGTPGYTTEKIFHAFAARCIPIYWGNPLVALDFNPRAFVNRHDFPDDDSCIAHVMELARDPQRMVAMLNEPVFAEGNDPSLRRQQLADFINHIFHQAPEEARRRTRYGYAPVYLRRNEPRQRSWFSKLNMKRKAWRKAMRNR
ncbi:Glycosyltransferase family 10 (fucosyltransferase) C-term [Rhizobium sp. RU35A]|nr:Glycosyltransferase family 10 (fucosyltransferase) C-term [Rhizobium sp. RU35A]